VLLVSESTQAELLQITRERAPLEAVGLILPDGSVVELPNHSDEPEFSFKASREDMRECLTPEVDLEEVALWHSHPGGGIGPSITDLRSKTPFLHHLVVSFVNDDLVLSWY
jgi:proteasome lid subunit RPN8/RPN11